MSRGAIVTALLAAVAVWACSSEDDAGAGPADPGGSSSGSSGASGTSGSSGSPGSSGGEGEGGAPDAAPPPPPPKPVYVVSTHETTTTSGGVLRKYNLSLPVDYAASRSYPLVLSFHGSPGNADVMLMYNPFDGASKKDAIVAYPNALDASWDLTASTSNVDMQFTKELVTELAGKYSIDTARVFGVGWSGGGFFVNMLACTFPSLMKAFASHSGGAPYSDIVPLGSKYPNGYPKCGDAESPVAAFIFHGQLDNTVPYGSGEFESSYWGYVNGCSDNASPIMPAPCVTHDGCPAGKPVVFCGYPAAGHGVEPTAFDTSWALFNGLP
ncbi:MAG: Esterase lipoprotein LpqC [Labilithrix sp.]|nr:Esterase lipoprotein LpqC [Labilithrix sp.]